MIYRSEREDTSTRIRDKHAKTTGGNILSPVVLFCDCKLGIIGQAVLRLVLRLFSFVLSFPVSNVVGLSSLPLPPPAEADRHAAKH